ncbi:hypothetical protein VPH35_089054 [Triticum aestivum]
MGKSRFGFLLRLAGCEHLFLPPMHSHNTHSSLGTGKYSYYSIGPWHLTWPKLQEAVGVVVAKLLQQQCRRPWPPPLQLPSRSLFPHSAFRLVFSRSDLCDCVS